ncbi:hypothetical protein D3C80_438330 [compost metagenome]
MSKTPEAEHQDRQQEDAHRKQVEPAEGAEDRGLDRSEQRSSLSGDEHADRQEKADDDDRAVKDRWIDDEVFHGRELTFFA